MLYLVATPIGDPDDLSVRAFKLLQEADVIICESTKETSKLLKHHQIKAQKYEVLNEHSKPGDLDALLQLCQDQKVVLVSDCGTPGFCDPGADLVRLCHQRNIPYTSILGPSSLMGLISLCGIKLDQFLFRGFLPAENQARNEAWIHLKRNFMKVPVIIMDTPYRLKKTLSEAQLHFPDREAFLALNLSQKDETLRRGRPESLLASLPYEKAEFMLLLT